MVLSFVFSWSGATKAPTKLADLIIEGAAVLGGNVNWEDQQTWRENTDLSCHASKGNNCCKLQKQGKVLLLHGTLELEKRPSGVGFHTDRKFSQAPLWEGVV